MSAHIDQREMSEDQERRIGVLERRLEVLYGTSEKAGNILAVHEHRLQRTETDIAETRRDLANGLRDVKQAIEKWPLTLRDELKEQADARHKRTLQFVSVIITTITAGGVAANNLVERMMQ